ncbi:cell filamentation protein [Lachnospiraceae bacterium XBB1006]|nr:cell filamentation protein [Lachnospiraceae bacterium XBB1006]
MDDRYNYDSGRDDKYCYPGTSVLKNKLNITEQAELTDIERQITMVRYFDLERQGVTGDFSLNHLCQIHRYLFSDLYDWAGKIRDVNIAKGTYFCFYPYIVDNFETVYRQLRKENYLLDIRDVSTMANRLAFFLGEINMIHPFREGNGRAQRMYLEQLCRFNGEFDLQFSHCTYEQMRDASIDAAVCQYGKMEEVLKQCLVDH